MLHIYPPTARCLSVFTIVLQEHWNTPSNILSIDPDLFAFPSREVLISCTGPDEVLPTYRTCRFVVARALFSHVPLVVRHQGEGSSIAAILPTNIVASYAAFPRSGPTYSDVMQAALAYMLSQECCKPSIGTAEYLALRSKRSLPEATELYCILWE